MKSKMFDAAFNAIQLSAWLEDPSKTETAELVAEIAVAMADEEHSNGLVWEGGYDDCLSQISRLIESREVNAMLLIARVPEIVREHMVAG